MRNPPRPSVLPRPADFSVSMGRMRRLRSAGRAPKMRPVSSEMARAKRSTCAIHLDFLQARQIDRRGGQQGLQAPIGEGDAERSAGEREQRAFDNRLGEQAAGGWLRERCGWRRRGRVRRRAPARGWRG